MDGFIRLALIASLASFACGCHSLVASRDIEKEHLASGASTAGKSASPAAAAASADGSATAFASAAPAAGPIPPGAAMATPATNAAAPGAAIAADLAGSQNAGQPASLGEITSTLDQLQSQGKLTPEARQRLQNDLAECDPNLLPGLLRMLQGSLEASDDGETPDAATTAQSAAAPAEGAAATPNAAQPQGTASSAKADAPSGLAASSRRMAINPATVRNPYADVVPGGESAAEPQGAVQLASAEAAAIRNPGDPRPFPEKRQNSASSSDATRRLPPAPDEVFKAYETLLAAQYPDTGAPELLAAIAAAKPIPKPSAGPVVQAYAEETPGDEATGRSNRSEETVLASFVREADVAGGAATAANANNTAASDTPGALQDASWQELLTTFIQRLETSANGPAETADQLRQQVYLRLLYVMAGRREEALEPIAGLSLAEQEFWNKLVYGLATHLDENRIPNRQKRAAEARRYFRDAAVRLGELAALEVRKLTFCTAVRSYGVVEPFPDNSFKAGDMVLLYAELDNFVAQRQAEGFRTEFRASYLIFDRLGRPVETEPHELPIITETCQNLRHDFFISYQVELPARMNPGEHKLQLTVHDMVGDKIGTAEVKFVVEP